METLTTVPWISDQNFLYTNITSAGLLICSKLISKRIYLIYNGHFLQSVTLKQNTTSDIITIKCDL
jgi:hypothetical protein